MGKGACDQGCVPGWRQVGREARSTGGRWRPVRETWALRAWVCPDLGRGFLELPIYLLSVNLLCSVAEHPSHNPDLAFLLLLASV